MNFENYNSSSTFHVVPSGRPNVQKGRGVVRPKTAKQRQGSGLIGQMGNIGVQGERIGNTKRQSVIIDNEELNGNSSSAFPSSPNPIKSGAITSADMTQGRRAEISGPIKALTDLTGASEYKTFHQH